MPPCVVTSVPSEEPASAISNSRIAAGAPPWDALRRREPAHLQRNDLCRSQLDEVERVSGPERPRRHAIGEHLADVDPVRPDEILVGERRGLAAEVQRRGRVRPPTRLSKRSGAIVASSDVSSPRTFAVPRIVRVAPARCSAISNSACCRPKRSQEPLVVQPSGRIRNVSRPTSWSRQRNTNVPVEGSGADGDSGRRAARGGRRLQRVHRSASCTGAGIREVGETIIQIY